MKKKILFPLITLVLSLTLMFSACSGFINPGDSLGGGGTVNNAPELTTSTLPEEVAAATSNATFAGTALPVGATPITGDCEITAAGNYVLRGDIALVGQIKISAEGVVLYFNGVNITKTTDKKAINAKKDTAIVLVNGTSNTITTTFDDADAVGGDDALFFSGSGSLLITTAGDAISAQAVVVKDSNITIISGKDGIHAEMDYDAVDTAPTAVSYTSGYVYADNATLNITSVGDAIQADSFVHITGGAYTLETNGGAPASITETSSDNGSGKAIKAGTIDYALASDPATELELVSDNYVVYIEGGTFNIDANDDAINSNGALFITGGTFTISSGDDAVHAEKLLQISGGDITVDNCYEGIEAEKVEISGGTMNVTSVDDGVNAADGTGGTSMQANYNCHIIIVGGSVTVSANGDGVDSNGNILITGGTLLVNGSANNENTAFDADGGILINGGNVFALGTLGMVETPATNSQQCVVSFASESNVVAGTVLSLTDDDGNVLFAMTTAKACRSVIISCPELSTGNSYSIYGGDSQLVTFDVASTITTVGTSNQINTPGGRPPMGR
jgi:hypothetical protein